MDDVVVTVLKQWPLLAVLAVLGWGLWKMMLRLFVEHRAIVTQIATEHRVALEKLGKDCHEAHAVIATEFRVSTEKLTDRYEDQASKAAAVASQLHNLIGESNELKRRTVSVLERVERGNGRVQ